ncbi:MAG: TIGR01459 family HAD-type hydrolase [Pseudomonadota bacterium]
MSTARAAPITSTLQQLAADHDAFLLDQFGVLLDGAGPYPGAAEALAYLAGLGKRILVLSNSGKRAMPNEARLAAMGFDRALYGGVLSSGEAAYTHLQHRIGAEIAPGAPVMVLARDGDRSAIEGLDLSVTDEPAKARLILIAGSEGEVHSLDHYTDLLRVPAASGVPAYCTNPDMTMLTAEGPAFGAGRIAAHYAELGGPVSYVGKPYPLIYREAAAALGNPDPARTVCIGDSPAHDIRGGRGAGLKTALVRTGIHRDDDLSTLLRDIPQTDRPDYILTRFSL